MKKLFFLLIISFVTYKSESQVLLSLIFGDKLNSENIEFGLDGGSSITKISNLDTKKYMSNWYLGFYFDLKIKTHFMSIREYTLNQISEQEI